MASHPKRVVKYNQLWNECQRKHIEWCTSRSHWSDSV